MRIRRLTIKNFRNFRDLTVDLDDHAVFVGANGVGKSNLLHAIRLVLDPSLPDSLRQLRLEDFWDGVPRPLGPDARIEVGLELTDFEKNDDQLASVAEHLVETTPMVARLTYVFRAKPTATAPLTGDDFEFFVYGGDREDNHVGYDVRRRLPAEVMHALRVDPGPDYDPCTAYLDHQVDRAPLDLELNHLQLTRSPRNSHLRRPIRQARMRVAPRLRIRLPALTARAPTLDLTTLLVLGPLPCPSFPHARVIAPTSGGSDVGSMQRLRVFQGTRAAAHRFAAGSLTKASQRLGWSFPSLIRIAKTNPTGVERR